MDARQLSNGPAPADRGIVPGMGDQPDRKQTACPHCGGTDIVSGVRTGQTAEAGSTGLQYQGLIFTGTEPLLADLCKSCGTVARLWVARADRDWCVAKQ